MNKHTKFSALLLASLCSPLVYADGINLDCSVDMPKLEKPLKDYEIIEFNMAHIATAGTFSGPQLAFTVKASPHKPKNEMAISSRMGGLVISAGERDQFKVTVVAINGCGKATSTFKVKIVPEEE